MGSQLKEALRCLCVEIGWSYAVFWRAIGSQGPMHLVWEDGHVVDSRVLVLVNKVMAQQVHVVGQGIVGEAAATGNHQWILRDTLHVNGSGTKGFAEANHHFLAGIQTITAIPVLPHGVLQLGSTQMVLENISFVNHVENLFAQLLSATSALLPDMLRKASSQNIQLCEGIPLVAAELVSDRLTTTTTSAPLCEILQPMFHPISRPNIPHSSQLENRYVGTEGLLFNPDMGLIQPKCSLDLSSIFQDQPSSLTSGLASNRQPFHEQHLEIRSLESLRNIEPELDNIRPLHVTPQRSIFPDSFIGSNIHPLSGRSDMVNNSNALGLYRSVLGGDNDTVIIPSTKSLNNEVIQMRNQRSYPISTRGIQVKSSLTNSSINACKPVLTAEDQKQDGALFEACDGSPDELGANDLCHQSILCNLQECRLSSSLSCRENQNFSDAINDANGATASQAKQHFPDGIYDADAANSASASQIEQENGGNEECKLPHVFPVQTNSANDLYDILGPDFKIDSFGGSFDIFENKNDAGVYDLSANNSNCLAQLDVSSISHPLNDNVSGTEMFPVVDANQLLDAVVSNINSGSKQTSDDCTSCKVSVPNTCSASFPVVSPDYKLIASSEQMQEKSFSLPALLGKTEEPGPSCSKSVCSLGNITEECSQDPGAYTSQISLWVGSGQSMHSDNISGGHSKRSDEISKPNRKRARPGENPRPRPKDRQMIMDRVKELREIVPNGAKCSIDALLEKTIKHMLFLQNVTKHSDNLKDIGEPKFIDKEGGLRLKESFQGGATWAFQVGSQSMTCPIIVEDLNPPRQMLVEMLCEQRGFFLEIADLIRGLGLTILKGVMESRKDKVWARFAVEANRDVTRMEIFLSLVRLLESTFAGSTAPQGLDNINMPHGMYHHSCIAATGTSDRIQ